MLSYTKGLQLLEVPQTPSGALPLDPTRGLPSLRPRTLRPLTLNPEYASDIVKIH